MRCKCKVSVSVVKVRGDQGDGPSDEGLRVPADPLSFVCVCVVCEEDATSQLVRGVLSLPLSSHTAERDDSSRPSHRLCGSACGSLGLT